MKLKICFIATIILFISFSTCAYANPTNYTASGEVITAEGYDCSIVNTDINLISYPPAYASTIETVVDAMYGWAVLEDMPYITYTSRSQPVIFTYYVTNEGNAVDSWYVGGWVMARAVTGFVGVGWTSFISIEGYSAGWNYYNGSTATQYSPPSNYSMPDWSKGQTRKVFLYVVPSTLESESPDGATLDVTTESVTYKTPVGVYQGANEFTYGGYYVTTDEVNVVIQSPVMKMTRYSTVDSPATSSGKYTGGGHDPVPGAIITYTILATNEGSVGASNVVILDRVPTDTIAAHIGMTGTARSANVDITAPSYNATDWTAYYTTEASPADKSYDAVAASWTEVTAPASIDAAAKWVGFTKVTVEATDSATITWGIIIP